MPKTLLLADDSVTIQKVVGISFASEDIRIVTVDNGDAAVAKARELRPDVVLADVVMPGLSGYEVCEALKADPALRHVPVLLLTGTFEAFDEERAARAGAAGHVAKPFEAQTLVERVKALLAASPAAAPEPVAAEPDAAFDFFGETDRDPLASDLSAEADAGGVEPLEFDESDTAFAFGDEELSPIAQEPVAAAPLRPVSALRPPTPPDATAAMLVEPRGAEDDAFDFDLGADEPADAPLEIDELGRGTLLDPPGAGFDVSSSDLAVESPPPAPPTHVIHAATFAPGDEGDPETDPFAGSDDDFALAEPLSTGADDTREAARPFGVEPEPWPAAREEAPAAVEWPEPEAYAAEAYEHDAPQEPEDLEPPPYEPARGPENAGPGAALAPALPAELRDTLEKIAWDAFGPVAEKIVRQALERIEQVAWEVVPKLAETLIQEEIRRLKDEDGAE